MIDWPKILDLEGLGNGLRISAQTFDPKAVVETLAVRRINRIIDRVVSKSGRNSARNDSLERGRAGNASVLQTFKENSRRIRGSIDIAHRVAIRDSEPRE